MHNEDTEVSQSIEIETQRFKEIFKGNPRVVLLAGGGGYIGLCIANTLASKGIKVLIMDNFIYNHGKSLLSSLLNKNIKFFQHDLRDELEVDFFKKNNITDVVVLAGLVGDPITKKYPELSDDINNKAIKGFINSANGQGINKLIFISTCSNYGLIKDGEKADENFELNPLSLYAQDKVNNEKYIIDNRNKFDFSATILRFATAFGAAPRMRFDLTVNEFIRDAYIKNFLEVYDADTWRPYCHVRDFAHLIERVLMMEIKKTDYQIFNAGGDSNNLTKRNIVDLIQKYIPNLTVKYVDGGTDPRNYIVDFSKVKKVLFFEPSWSVNDGIKELINFLENGLYNDVEIDKNFYGNYQIINEQ